jgi:putative DNA primase/helicase
MLVLEDDEGKGKSRLIRALANGWFTDDFSFGLSSKEVVEQAKGSLIIEVAEMSTRSSADVEHIKAFLSRGEERVRMAYARNTGYFPRRWIVAGTTNETEYLKSDTGNRRFWCVRGDGREIDVDAVKKIVPQLWAEAKDRYLNCAEPLYLEDKTVLAFAIEQQAARVQGDDWSGAVENWLDGKTPDDFDQPGVRRDRTSALQVWCEAIGGDFEKFRKSDAYRIGSIMRKLGWEAHSTVRLSDKYGRGRGFVRKRSKMSAI